MNDYDNVSAYGTTRGRASTLSPYLNFDPSYLDTQQPEFIFPEGASRQRGRFELAFSQIGASVMGGATIGGATGLYNGIRQTALAGHTGKLRMTQVLNYTMKQGANVASSLGVIAVMYSGTGVLLSLARGSDDEVNTVASGAITGLLYKSSAGLKTCLKGGAVGLALTSAYCAYTSDRIRNFFK
ncbi:mitochondrial import inner membrane translocase subunit Tim23-like [Artemia franciscana]|uniref:Mitochondrial import inner membrane translocase subunit Tim23 n=2 Tax=Artemia franciscana TaxID=6661 RepID=A0AA88L5C7_ARTSF|nr:hypothetical protein QYM36_009331 [Artemia franciscana]